MLLSLQIALIQGAKIVKPDQFAKNGVIQVIDKVIERTTKSIIQFISSRIEFKKFVELTRRLGTNLKGPVTLFLPTNSAFSKLSSELWNFVSSNESCLRVRMTQPFFNCLLNFTFFEILQYYL